MLMYKKGMYVRVPLDESEEQHRYFAIGQIVRFEEENAVVKLHNINNLLEIYEYKSLYKIEKNNLCRALPNDYIPCMYKNKTVKLIGTQSNKDYNRILIFDGNNYVYTEENNVVISFCYLKVDPLEQLINQEFHNSIYFTTRLKPLQIYKKLEFSSFGFKELYNSRVYLMKHQIDTVIKALKMDGIRLMLADEVGLGKTIQACIILRAFMNRNRKKHSLIIVPKHLEKQWENELINKFWTNVRDSNENVQLIAMEDYISQSSNLSKKKFDFIIVDEVHNYLSDNNICEMIVSLSKNTENILILSATPIQNRMEEYLRLLKILEPGRFEKMTIEEFKVLSIKQDNIRDQIYGIVKNIDTYEEDEFFREDIDEEFEGVVAYLKDSILNEFYREFYVSNQLSDKLYYLKCALSYISNYYQFERRIIRHRKMELRNKFANRVCLSEPTDLGCKSNRYYDSVIIFNEVITLLTQNKSVNFHLVKETIQAFYSSPHAFKKIYVESIQSIVNEPLKIKADIYVINEWIKELDFELENLKNCFDDPDTISFKMLNVLDYIDQNLEYEKIVIIFDCIATLDVFERIIAKEYKDSTCYAIYRVDQDNELNNDAILKFQESDECRILIADKSAGEGKNLQMGSTIIHYDLQWSPSNIEQRIGRLDRIGRDLRNDVKSVVFFEQNSIEEELFQLWYDVFQVYTGSISGMEIILNDVDNIINQGLIQSGLHGISEQINNISELINRSNVYLEKERYYDVAKQLNPVTERKYEKLIEDFSKENESILTNSVLEWGGIVGFNHNRVGSNSKRIEFNKKNLVSGLKSLKNSLFPLPNTKKIMEYSSKQHEFIGTFNRETAILNESIVFFAPGEEVFDSLFTSAVNSYKGRTTAIKVYGKTDADFFVFKWTVEVDYDVLSRYEVDISTFEQFLDIVETQVFVDYFLIDGYIDDEMVRELLNNIEESRMTIQNKKIVYAAGRSRSIVFKHPEKKDYYALLERYPKELWTDLVAKAISLSRSKVQLEYERSLDLRLAIGRIDERKIALENANKYFMQVESAEHNYINIINMLHNVSPFKLVFDSSALFFMEAKNDEF